jgi:predicted MFS family arabinose efflux permease
MTPYLAGLGVGYAMIGLIGSAYGMTQVLLRIPLGIVSDRMRRRRVLISVCLFFGALSSVGFYFAENEWLIFFFRAMSGVAASAWVIMTVLFSSYFASEKAAAKTSRLTMVNNLGQATGMLVGSALAGYAGYKSSFMLSIATGAASFILSFFIDEKAPSGEKPPPTIRETLRVGENRTLLIMSVLCSMMQIILFGSTLTFLPEVARRLGASSQALGYLSFISSIPRILSALICSFLLARTVDRRKLICSGFLLVAAATAITPFMPNLTALFAAALLCGFGIGIVQTITLVLCTAEIDESLKSTGMGFYQAIYGIGMAAGPALVGIVADRLGLVAGYIFAAVVSLAGAVITILFVSENHTELSSSKPAFAYDDSANKTPGETI